MSTDIRRSALDAAAFMTERIAFAIRPERPITFPMSCSLTESVRTSSPSLSSSVAWTSYGNWTRALAIVSSNSFILNSNHCIHPLFLEADLFQESRNGLRGLCAVFNPLLRLSRVEL